MNLLDIKNPLLFIFIFLLVVLLTFLFSLIYAFLRHEYQFSSIEKAMNEKNFEKVIDLSLRYIKHKPGSFILYYYMAQSYEFLHHYQNAIEYFEKALLKLENMNKPNLKNDLLLKTGELYQKLQKYIEARGYYELLLRTSPRNQTVLWNLANIYFNVNNLTKSKECLDKNLSVNPRSWKAKYLMARVCFKMEDYNKTIILLKELLDSSDTNIHIIKQEAIIMLSECYMNKNRYPETVQLIKSLFEQQKQVNIDLIIKLIIAEIRMGDLEQALFYSENYIVKSTVNDKCFISYEMGNAYFKRGDIYKALSYWKYASNLNPQYRDIEKILEKYVLIIENPILENLYTSNKDMSLSFILKKFNSMEKNIMEVQIDFTILKDNEICDIIFQSPLILSNKKMETIEEIIKNYGYVGLNITLFSIYGVDEIALQSSFFRRIKLIEQLEFVTFFKKGIAGTIPEDR